MSLKDRLLSERGKSALKKSAISLREGEDVFRHFLKGKGYRTILEIGTYKGVSAACMSQYCENVITIDLEHGQLENAGEAFDRHELWQSMGVDNVALHLVRNNAKKRDLIRSLDFDFAFIDGAHDHTVSDDFAMVRKCGAVLFHDYSDRPGKPNYVKRFVDTLGPVEVVDIFAFWRR